MGGSPKTPKKSDAEQKAEDRQLEIQEEQLALAKKQAEMPLPKIPKALPIPPPPTQSSVDVAAAEEEARQQAAKRTNTARGTLFAGETGGYGKTGGARTLLG